MGLFNRNNENNINEELCRDNLGYVYGKDSGIIYHVPQTPSRFFEFPNGTKGLSQTAIMELRNLKATHIVIPGTFKKVNIQLLNFEYLSIVEFREGVEEVKCIFDGKKDVDVILPTTIKKIGAHNYSLAKNLVLPNGVIEIENMFASHDTNLISVNIPGTLKIIPTGAFNQCKNLQSIILNEGVETSMKDAFRGTNNLHTLELPSTYNGRIELSMDNRPLSNVRRNSKYDGKNFEEEKNQILTIKIRRENKKFEFNIKRGEQPAIEIKGNIIKIKSASHPQVISIDCNQLEPGLYNIQNGTIEIQKSQSFQEQSEKQENILTSNNQNSTPSDSHEDNIDIIFQNAYREYITKREDFAKLPGDTKMQVKKQMKALFLELNFGNSDINNEIFDYLYTKTLNEINYNPIKIEKTHPKKLNRPHIREDVRKKVVVIKIEQDRDLLRIQREMILEGQRLASEGQAFQTTETLLEEELEDNNGMSM